MLYLGLIPDVLYVVLFCPLFSHCVYHKYHKVEQPIMEPESYQLVIKTAGAAAKSLAGVLMYAVKASDFHLPRFLNE